MPVPIKDTDFFLQSCQIGERAYTLSGPLARGAIRDTMWRSQALCERLALNGLIHSNSKILIIGGGIAGVTCAITASVLGARATIIEASNRLAKRQADCDYRVICPSTFDFPFAHWPFGSYPIQGDRAVLPWNKGVSSRVYRAWMFRFQEFLENGSDEIKVYLSSTIQRLDGWNNSSAKVQCEFQGILFQGEDEVPKPESDEFDLVILCFGLGDERSQIPLSDFESFAFWDNNDPIFDFSNISHCQSYAQQPLLLVGGGDGSLGDFVALLTGQMEFARVISEIKFSSADRDAIHRLRLMLCSYNQLGGIASEHGFLAELHKENTALVESMWARRRLRKRVSDILRPKDLRPFVQIAIKCFHFPYGFMANRIIAELLARALAEKLPKENGDISPFRMGVETKTISGFHPHVCAGNKRQCLDYSHEVTFDAAVCAHLQGSAVSAPEETQKLSPMISTSTSPCQYRRVLLRIGAGNYDKLAYALPKELKDLAVGDDSPKSVSPFKLITPFYPV